TAWPSTTSSCGSRRVWARSRATGRSCGRRPGGDRGEPQSCAACRGAPMHTKYIKLRPRPLTRFFFWLACAVSAFLILLVLLAPLLDTGDASDGWELLLALFASDTTLRRTAIACALGLLVTAFVFFRTEWGPLRRWRRRRRHPPQRMAGA